MEESLPPGLAVEFARYKIYCEYSGLWDDTRLVALAHTAVDAKMIVDALEAQYADRGVFRFWYVLCDEYKPEYDKLDFEIEKPGAQGKGQEGTQYA